jgi:hypothetical protein
VSDATETGLVIVEGQEIETIQMRRSIAQSALALAAKRRRRKLTFLPSGLKTSNKALLKAQLSQREQCFRRELEVSTYRPSNFGR